MEMKLRLEQEKDYREVESLTREAFFNHHGPGCDEHYLAHILRKSPCFIKELDFIAEINGEIAGNIMYSHSHIQGDNGKNHPVITFGPLSVLPKYQGLGVGKALIEDTKKLARDMGYRAILIFGDPEFYKKTGFVPAESFKIGTSHGTYAAAHLACPLFSGALEGCEGLFIEGDIFNLDMEKAKEFDKYFPNKERVEGLASQERFKALVAMQKPRII